MEIRTTSIALHRCCQHDRLRRIHIFSSTLVQVFSNGARRVSALLSSARVSSQDISGRTSRQRLPSDHARTRARPIGRLKEPTGKTAHSSRGTTSATRAATCRRRIGRADAFDVVCCRRPRPAPPRGGRRQCRPSLGHACATRIPPIRADDQRNTLECRARRP